MKQNETFLRQRAGPSENGFKELVKWKQNESRQVSIFQNQAKNMVRTKIVDFISHASYRKDLFSLFYLEN